MARAKKAAVKKGFELSKRTAILGIVGILIFSIIGGIAWQNWQDQRLVAKAENWQPLYSYLPQVKVVACKIDSNNGRMVITNSGTTAPKIVIQGGASFILGAGKQTSSLKFASSVTYGTSTLNGVTYSFGAKSSALLTSSLRQC